MSENLILSTHPVVAASANLPADAILGSVRVRDASHDRPAQSAAALPAADDSEETLTHTTHGLLDHTRPAVLDLQLDMPLLSRHCDPHEGSGQASGND